MHALIKSQREKIGISYNKLSKITNISVGALYNIENGLSSPTLNNLGKICKALNISITVGTLDEVLTMV